MKDVYGNESEYDSVEIIVDEIVNNEMENGNEKLLFGILLVIFLIILLFIFFGKYRKSKNMQVQNQNIQQKNFDEKPTKIESEINDEFL